MEEYFFRCPYCYAEISTLIDPSPGDADYEEDCEVCCRPIRLRFKLLYGSDGTVRIRGFRATTSDDL